MVDSISNNSPNPASLAERMHRAHSEASQTTRADDADEGKGAQSTNSAAPDAKRARAPVDDSNLGIKLIHEARSVAEALLADEITESNARRRIVHTILDDASRTDDRPDVAADVEALLCDDLQFRAEVDNMLVLAARELGGLNE